MTGKQAILNQELFVSNNNTNNQDTFGYQSRYAEYKYKSDLATGDFRDNMDHWHLTRSFDIQPVLNSEFVACNPDTRIFAVEGTTEDPIDHLWCQIYNHVTVLRSLPYLGTPTL